MEKFLYYVVFQYTNYLCTVTGSTVINCDEELNTEAAIVALHDFLRKEHKDTIVLDWKRLQ